MSYCAAGRERTIGGKAVLAGQIGTRRVLLGHAGGERRRAMDRRAQSRGEAQPEGNEDRRSGVLLPLESGQGDRRRGGGGARGLPRPHGRVGRLGVRRYEGRGADAEAGDAGGDQGRPQAGRPGAGAAIAAVGDAGVEAALGPYLPDGRMEGMSEDSTAPSPQPPPARGGGAGTNLP